MTTSVRYPVIALDYSEKDKALLKELMVDYTTGNIYVVSATDKSIIFNITEKIITEINDLDAEHIEVNIEGIGMVNLTIFLNQLNKDVKDTVHVKDPGDIFSYIIRDTSIDNKSLKIFNGNIQIDNYIGADTSSIPQKTLNGIRWMPMSELIAGLGSIGGTEGSGGYSEVDGDLKTVPVITNSNNKMYLSSHAQKSYNVIGNFAKVFLPTTVDEYSVIKWQIIQFETDLELIFDSNIFLAKNIVSNTNITIINMVSDSKLVIPKCTDALKVIYKFIFETFDNGITWILNVDQFNSNAMY